MKVVPATELLADNEEEAPSQITAGEAKGVITGLGFTVTETVFDPVHPAAVPVTV